MLKHTNADRNIRVKCNICLLFHSFSQYLGHVASLWVRQHSYSRSVFLVPWPSVVFIFLNIGTDVCSLSCFTQCWSRCLLGCLITVQAYRWAFGTLRSVTCSFILMPFLYMAKSRFFFFFNCNNDNSGHCIVAFICVEFIWSSAFQFLYVIIFFFSSILNLLMFFCQINFKYQTHLKHKYIALLHKADQLINKLLLIN